MTTSPNPGLKIPSEQDFYFAFNLFLITKMQNLAALLLFIAMTTVTSAGALQNSDFESMPSNLLANSTTPFALLNGNTTIPGWSFEGVVQYVTAGPNISLPGNGHAIRLGPDGKINQTFKADGNGDAMDYMLTFALAPDGQDCLASADLVISAPDSESSFPLQQRYGNEAWESYGHYLGTWGNKPEPINLIIKSQSAETDPNMTCWPIIDDILLKGAKPPTKDNGNLLANGGFEWGPAFLHNSTEGMLLEAEGSPAKTALRPWAVLGTVKYIDSEHYRVPEGKAAVEIVSGVASGIMTVATVKNNSHYSLQFTLGDANDGCAGKFILQAQAGTTYQNFSLNSNGTGSANKFSMAFKAIDEAVPISFLSYTASQTRDGMFCGPVVDDVILRAASLGVKLQAHSFFACLSIFVALLLLRG